MIEIDSQSPVPTYEQILLQIRAAIAAGTLASGASLPPIRQLAQDLDINPATVAKAYQMLEKDGIIQTAGRKGTFVHAHAQPNLKSTLQKEATDQIRGLLSHWEERGLAAADLKVIFNRVLANRKEKENP
jgi:GntR family transcriptional regulator